MLRGVEVVVKNGDTGLTRSGLTDANGYFTMPGLPPGTYEVPASLPGFDAAIERVTLAVAQETGLNLKLNITGTQESITVLGVSPIRRNAERRDVGVVTDKRFRSSH
ncbi:MAG: carboxypeptidase-like regulatory domain-containing protein [Vicinamibacterales bacterium]